VSASAGDSVDAASVSEARHEHDALFDGGQLSERIRSHDEGPFQPRRVSVVSQPGVEDVALGAATQIEIESGHVRFLVPFDGRWPSEPWLLAFRRAQLAWPPQLVEPRLDEGRGLQLGPLPAAELDDAVRALKELVASSNRLYRDEIEPELRRQREEALRREQEEHRLQAEVEARLKLLLG
jgi:hypothetical protein